MKWTRLSVAFLRPINKRRLVSRFIAMGFDARCARKGGRLLQHDTSTDVARDLNLLRQAAGARWRKRIS
jgi:hypothetical protein